MEKLIKLLNEHRVELLHGNIQNKPMRHYSSYVFGLSDLTEQNCILLVISKEYGFIKWLVDNDKIDRKKLEIRPFSDELVYSDSDCTVYRSDTTYEMLLMLLAIQDEPIEFLISVLK